MQKSLDSRQKQGMNMMATKRHMDPLKVSCHQVNKYVALSEKEKNTGEKKINLMRHLEHYRQTELT